VHFSLGPIDEGDLKIVAVVQALLCGGLARLIHDTGRHADIGILLDDREQRSARAGLKALMVPLLPFASRYIPASVRDDRFCAGDDLFVERMLIGQVQPDAAE
jgi:hypothetical protein